MTTVPPDAAEPLEPLTYKRWILKVSIHCEGCRRKVKKVLHSIEVSIYPLSVVFVFISGVYNVNIETKQQKVVVTGNVEAETLIKKLTKSGKHAELWPEIGEQKEKKSNKSKKKEKQSDPERNSQEAGHGGLDPDVEKQAVKVEVVKEPPRSSEGGGGSPAKISGCGAGGSVGAVKFSDGVVKISGGSGGGGAVKFSDGLAKISCGGGGGGAKFSDGVVKTSGGSGGAGGGGGVKFSDVVVKTSGGGQGLESKPEGKKPETGALGNHSPAADKDNSESDDSAGKSGGNSGKKKKKQGQKTAPEADPSSGGVPTGSGSPNGYAGPPQVNLSPPRHYAHQYPPHYYAPPQPKPPVYAANYNTAYPTSSYTTSYYASPAPHSYAYTYPSLQMEPAPSDSDYSYERQPLDSFEIFSDENPNGCSIM
ncbi:hypothetical protein U1Q18_004248 [Sarracenia purpurea var. burkii]